jgi:anti-anti-sigma factor
LRNLTVDSPLEQERRRSHRAPPFSPHAFGASPARWSSLGSPLHLVTRSVEHAAVAQCHESQTPERAMTELTFAKSSLAATSAREGAYITGGAGRLGVRLSVHGYVDLATSPRLGHRIGKALTLPVDRIAIDLRDVEFIDSSGLHVLNDARLATLERQIDLVLISPSRCVRRVLDLCAMTDLFDIRSS